MYVVYIYIYIYIYVCVCVWMDRIRRGQAVVLLTLGSIIRGSSLYGKTTTTEPMSHVVAIISAIHYITVLL